jgi:hypothetical protein
MCRSMWCFGGCGSGEADCWGWDPASQENTDFVDWCTDDKEIDCYDALTSGAARTFMICSIPATDHEWKRIVSSLEIPNFGFTFAPKDHSASWRVSFGDAGCSGYDFVLVIENRETKVSYQWEMGICQEGTLAAQLTTDRGDNGPDAMMLMTATPDRVVVSGNRGGPEFLIERNKPALLKDDTAPAASVGFV